MTPNTTKIIEKAQRGEKPTTSERRHALSYLMVSGKLDPNAALGELFKVSERQIKLDKKWLREQTAKDVREDDPMLVVADLVMSFEKAIREVERSMAKCKLGSRTYLEHASKLFRMQLDKVKALQDLAVLPKNLGNLSVTKYSYAAYVGRDGSVETRPTDLAFDDVEEIKALPEPSPSLDIAEREAEFEEV